jgi:superfamily II DNA or RNA helicase
MATREEIQIEAATESLLHYKCGLALSMRVGKTKIALMNLEQRYFSGIRALVVAPKTIIFKGWKEDILKFGYQRFEECITYVTYRSLHKLNPDDYDIVYLDEFHSLKYSHIEFLSAFKGKIVGLTGTEPTFEGSEKYKMMEAFCPVVYRYTTDDAVNDKVLNDYRVFVHLLDLSRQKNIKVETKNNSFYTSELMSYSHLCKRVEEAESESQLSMARLFRMKAMMEFPTKEKYADILMKYIKHKMIVFANTKKQADRLCQFSYHSSNKSSDANLNLLKDDIISQMSCVGQISEGVTIPGVKACVILHAYANNSKLAQRAGRALGLDTSEVADIHVLCFRDTEDVKWVNSSLEGFDENKITYFDSSRLMIAS